MNSNDIIIPMATMAGLTLLVALRLGIANSWAVISKKVYIKYFRQFFCQIGGKAHINFSAL